MKLLLLKFQTPQLQLQDSQALKDKSLVSLAASIYVLFNTIKKISIDFCDIKKIIQNDLDLENLRAKSFLNNPEIVVALITISEKNNLLSFKISNYGEQISSEEMA
jgi:hypothetical protein